MSADHGMSDIGILSYRISQSKSKGVSKVLELEHNQVKLLELV